MMKSAKGKALLLSSNRCRLFGFQFQKFRTKSKQRGSIRPCLSGLGPGRPRIQETILILPLPCSVSMAHHVHGERLQCTVRLKQPRDSSSGTRRHWAAGQCALSRLNCCLPCQNHDTSAGLSHSTVYTVVLSNILSLKVETGRATKTGHDEPTAANLSSGALALSDKPLAHKKTMTEGRALIVI